MFKRYLLIELLVNNKYVTRIVEHNLLVPQWRVICNSLMDFKREYFYNYLNNGVEVSEKIRTVTLVSYVRITKEVWDEYHKDVYEKCSITKNKQTNNENNIL